jgi:DnaK suppressor protein
MDDLDRAKELEMAQRQQALDNQRHRAQITEQPLVIDGVRCCIDCEMPIPPPRLAVQPESVRCVDCKSTAERAHR